MQLHATSLSSLLKYGTFDIIRGVMFSIDNSRDFYEKLLAEFDDYIDDMGSTRHAMNCAITAHHMSDWVWTDFLKADRALRAAIGVESKQEFMAWIDRQSTWFSAVQEISNGSKHFSRLKKHKLRLGFDDGRMEDAFWDKTHLAYDIGVGEVDSMGRYTPVPAILEVLVRFWRDFLLEYSPYKHDMPLGRSKLDDVAEPGELGDIYWIDWY
jgi:hypothetical protein